jgi:putative spermidine/putrescine transport system ATP-binding protein
MTCRLAGALAPGDAAIISLRPEQITVGTADGHANRFTARVEDIAYLGDHVRLRLVGEAGIEFIAKLPNRAAFRRHDTLALGFSADDARAFPALDQP